VAVIGGAVTLGLAFATGAVHASAGTTTIVESSPPVATSTSSSAASPWKAVYAQTAPGTVDITAQTQTTANTRFETTDTGSGFIINGKGDILTAAHVVARAQTVTVSFPDGVTRKASVLGEDDSSDVAVLHVDPAGLTLFPLTLGSSRSLAIGQAVGVVGDPLGFDRSLSTGVVSGLDRTIQAPDGFSIAHSVQTDAALNPGNSGGPVLDFSGRVIGIADQIATGASETSGTGSDTSTGVGFAVPIDLAKDELSQLEAGRQVSHAYLGVSTTPAIGGAQQGALVAAVETGTPAAKAGLRAGDVIVGVDGRALGSADALIDTLAADHPGQHVRLKVLRGSATTVLTATLSEQPAQAPSG
jgi:putative serine protease PepD